MKTKKLLMLVLMLYFLLNLKPVLAEEQNFKNIGSVLSNGKEVPLSIKDKVGFTEHQSHYEFNADKATFIKIGEVVIKIPSNSRFLVSKDLSISLTSGTYSSGNSLIELSSDSEGEIVLPEENLLDLSVGLFNKGMVSLKGLKQRNIKVNRGAIVVDSGNKIYYTHPHSATLQIESVSNLKIGNNGFNGAFKIFNNEGLTVGEIEGLDVIPVLNSGRDKVIGKNIIIFYDDFRNKQLFGSLKYVDFAYDYILSAENAEINLNLNAIHFKNGGGYITRTIKSGNLNWNQKFVVDKEKVLVQPFLDSEAKGRTARSDLIISAEKNLIAVDRLGEIHDSNSKERVFSLFDYWDLSFLENRDEDTKALYSSYLLSGFNSNEAILLADAKIEVKDGASFLKKELLRLLGTKGVKELIRKRVPADLAEAYVNAGVADYFQIISLIDDEVEPFNLKQYSPLLKKDFGEVARLEVPIKAISEYKDILKGYIRDPDLGSGKVYAKLHYYGILPTELKSYSKVFKKLKEELRPENLIDIVRLLSPTEVEDYLKAGVNEPKLMVQLFEYGIKPKEALKYKVSGKFYFYPRITPEDVKAYSKAVRDRIGVYGKDIAILKLLKISPKDAGKFLDDLSLRSSHQKKKKEEIMKNLDLNEDRYSLPFLNLVYENWQSNSANKPIALIILNRNDPIVEYYEGVSLAAFKAKDGDYLPLFKDYHVLLFEASTDNEIAQHLRDVNGKFGAIDKLIIGGHGYSQVISLGMGKNEESLIDKSDLSLFKTIRATTNKNSDIFLLSCSTGKGKKTIGEMISKSTGRNTFAPTCDATTTKFVLNKQGKLVSVEYGKR